MSDHGIGIEPDALPRIFNAFEQGDSRLARALAGLGLGLTIAKALMDAHGGTITATSDGKDKGATFVVEIATVPAPAVRRRTMLAASRPPPRRRIARCGCCSWKTTKARCA